MVEVARELPEPRADDEEQVGAPAGGRRLRRARAPQGADVERMRVGHRVVPAVRRDHGNRVLVAETHDEVVGLGARDAPADQQERPLGSPQQPRRLADGLRMRRQRMRDPVVIGREDRRLEHLLVQDVSRDLHEHRARPAAHGRAQRRAQQLGDALRLGHLDGELGHRAEHAHEVVVLERVLLVVLQGHPADEDDDGRVGHVRGGHAGQQIGGPRTARHQADARMPGHARQPVGHEGGGLLVAHVDVLDAVIVVEGVEDVEEGRADDPEDVPHLLRLQELDHRASGRQLAHLHLSLCGAQLRPTIAHNAWAADTRRHPRARPTGPGHNGLKRG